MQSMHPESRMWFYGLAAPLTDQQAEVLKTLMNDFVGQWKAHGAQLAAAYRIIGNQCLIIAVDERQQQATGCSIDKSVHLLMEFGQEFGVDFFNRMLVFTTDNAGIKAFTPAALKEAISAGSITAETPVLHTLATTLHDSGNGMIPLGESWAKRYL
jgi:hypothetical protein